MVLEYILSCRNTIRRGATLRVALPFLSIEGFASHLGISVLELRGVLREYQSAGILSFTMQMNFTVDERTLKVYKDEGSRMSRDLVERIMLALSNQGTHVAHGFAQSHRRWCEINGVSPHL